MRNGKVRKIASDLNISRPSKPINAEIIGSQVSRTSASESSLERMGTGQVGCGEELTRANTVSVNISYSDY